MKSTSEHDVYEIYKVRFLEDGVFSNHKKKIYVDIEVLDGWIYRYIFLLKGTFCIELK
jgi:hypothetical protein